MPEPRSDVLAVVPTFAPDAAAAALVRGLAQEVPVLVSDDASPCTADAVLRELSAIAGVTVVRHARNAGIARGLNDGLRAALAMGATWLLSVDQDTQLPDGYLRTVLDRASQLADEGVRIGAIGTVVIDDASGRMVLPTRVEQGIEVTDELIQTGTCWSVAALTGVGGFDERLGMDAVDAAACLALRSSGYLLPVAPLASLRHRIGQSRRVRFLGREVMVTGHSPERRASMLANRLRLFPGEFRQSPAHAVRTLRRVAVNQALGLALEDDRGGKAHGSIRGLLGNRGR